MASNFRIEKNVTDSTWEIIRKSDAVKVETAPTHSAARQVALDLDAQAGEFIPAEEPKVLQGEEVTVTVAGTDAEGKPVYKIDLNREAQAEALSQIVKAAKAGDIQGRNAGIRTARDLKVTRAHIAEAAGVSINYLQHILKPQARPAKSGLTKFQEGYQEALADIAAKISGLTDEDAGLAAAAWIEDNRLAAAADIFARAAAEHAS